MGELLHSIVLFFFNPNTWGYALLALIPVIGYSFFFYLKIPRPRPKKIFLLTFFASCFSVVPLLFYQYFYLHYFPIIESSLMLGKLATQPLLVGLFQYCFHISFISLLIFIIAFIIAILITFFAKKTFQNVFQSILEENFNFQFIAFGVGLLVLIEFFLGEYFGVFVFQSVLGVIILKAMMEEYSKHLIVRFIDDDELFNIDDAIALSLFAGLAFAFVENILYFSRFSENLFTLFLGRSFLTVLAHLVFSGIFGYYYGIAHFASPLYFEKHTVSGQKSTFLKIISKIFNLQQSNLFREITILKGLLVATCIHSLFNFLLELQLTQFAFLLIFISTFYLIYLLKKKENYRQLGFIGTAIMPISDFKNLTWKIESLRWAKEIRAERMRNEIKKIKVDS